MHERIKHLRKDILHLTQDEFASAIKISRSNLGNIETGRINITDRIVSDICEHFNVNEIWLRIGEGSPILSQSKDEELSALLGALLNNPEDTLQKRFITALLKLPPESWIIIANELEKKD